MDVREKLVELLDIIIQPGQKTLGDIADYLISNGVTVQEWISVKEHPKERGEYLCYLKYEPESSAMIHLMLQFGIARCGLSRF